MSSSKRFSLKARSGSVRLQSDESGAQNKSRTDRQATSIPKHPPNVFQSLLRPFGDASPEALWEEGATVDWQALETALRRKHPGSRLLPPLPLWEHTSLPSNATTQEQELISNWQQRIEAAMFQPALDDSEVTRFLNAKEILARVRTAHRSLTSATASLIKTINWWRHQEINSITVTETAGLITAWQSGSLYRRGFDLYGRPLIWAK